MGKPVQSLEMLAGLVVVMLVCGWSEGLVLNKCELKSQLQKALIEHQSDIIAKVICTVEHISFFNTSLVTVIQQTNHGGLIQYQEVNGDYVPEDGSPGGRVTTENPAGPSEVPVDDGFVPDEMPPTEVIADPWFLVEGLPTEIVEPETPPFSPEVETDDLILVRPIDHLDYASIQDNNQSGGEGSGDEMSGNGSEEGSKSPPKDESGSGEPLEPTITTIPQQDNTDNDNERPFFPGGWDWSALPPNEEVHYDTEEFLFGYKKTPNPSDVPFNHENGPEYPDNGPFYPQYEQDSTSRILYGIFQLSGDMACQSLSTYSMNFCNLDCQNLTDDNITDDIACLMALQQQERLVFAEECQSVEASEYLAGCD